MTERAVIDRFENGWAVLLVGEDERRLDVERTQLPEDAKEGDWLQLEIEGDRLVSAVVDAEAMAQARQRIMSKLMRLRRGGSPEVKGLPVGSAVEQELQCRGGIG